MQEQHRGVEIDREILSAYTHTFIPRFDRYSQQNADGTYVAIRHQLTLDIVEAHIRGAVTLGAYALDVQSWARWLCLDADDESQWSGLLRLAKHLTTVKLPAYLEKSRRGGHLWLFFDSPLSGREARRFAVWLKGEYDLPPKMEVYPAQDELRTGPGSLVRLPLGVHRKTNKRYHFITLVGEPIAPTIREQMKTLSNPEPFPTAFVQDVISALPEPAPVFPTPRFTKQGEVVGNTPSERVKNSVSVLDFVSQYIDLDQNNRGLCPFHDDHRQSFSVDERGNYWRCFAKCEGHTVIDFMMKWRELHGQDGSFTATITELAKMLLD